MMKKFILPLLAMLVLTLCACEGGRVMDVWIFMERWNRSVPELAIDPASLIYVDDGEKKYELFLLPPDGGEKLMLTLYPDSGGSIRRCDVTAEKAAESSAYFYAAAKSAALALTKETEETIAAILAELKLTDTKSPDRARAEYVTTHLFDYCLISNEMGVSFYIENLRLTPGGDSEMPSLRQK